MHEQDSSDPTGVSVRYGKGHGKELANARARKANAAVQMRLAGATWAAPPDMTPRSAVGWGLPVRPR